MTASRLLALTSLLALVGCGPQSPAQEPAPGPETSESPGSPVSTGGAAPEPEPGPEPEPEPEPDPEPPKLAAPNGTIITPCPDDVPEGMACVPGGPFIRGVKEKPVNAVPQEIVWVQSFYMDVNEVTYSEYKACEKEGKCDKAGPQYIDFDDPQQPMNGPNWFHVKKYCEAQGKRLPTEAEWEMAARGTDGRTYPWGEKRATCKEAIIKGAEGRGCGRLKRGDEPETGKPWPVGSREPNQFGLYDMAGNSWEWVQDWYTRSYEHCGDDCRGVNPKGPCDGAESCPGHVHKIVRGGSWFWPADYATTYRRRPHVPSNDPFHHFGFRCAKSIEGADYEHGVWPREPSESDGAAPSEPADDPA